MRNSLVENSTSATPQKMEREGGRAAALNRITVGIAGGGQLARMMLEAAPAIGLETVVLDPDPACSAATLAENVVTGNFDSFADIMKLASQSDVVTYEIEAVDADILAQLEERHVNVNPSAEVLATIQDKLRQKRFLSELGIPTAEFRDYDANSAAVDSFPIVWKARRGGYDGRGVAIVRTASELADLPEIPALLEAAIDIEREVAIVISRDLQGNTRCYPLTDIYMDPALNVLDTVVAPSTLSKKLSDRCEGLAQKIADALNYVGVLAIEFFVTTNSEILVNELSPRPHNSGHYTIEACETSQFEQHLRAVAGLDLGSTQLTTAAATFNLLGPITPASVLPLVEQGLLGSNVYVHDYGKSPARAGRKLGHLTVTADSADAAYGRAVAIKKAIYEAIQS